jgi:anti-sigma regulatory factor (Ser/Thr protein kinase)
MKKKFKRHINSLEKIFKFLEEFEERHKLDKSISFAINLAVEELFTNMVKYRAKNPNDILIDLSKDANKVFVVLTDYDVEPYDIKQAKTYDAKQPLEDREAGGVGIHLVKKFIDDIDYKYHDGTSKITLIKYLEKRNV